MPKVLEFPGSGCCSDVESAGEACLTGWWAGMSQAIGVVSASGDMLISASGDVLHN